MHVNSQNSYLVLVTKLIHYFSYARTKSNNIKPIYIHYTFVYIGTIIFPDLCKT